MKLLLENWRKYLNESTQDRRMQMLKLAAILHRFRRGGSQNIFDKTYTVPIVGGKFIIDKLPFLGFSDEEVSQLDQDLRAVGLAARQERWTSYEGPAGRLKELTTQYNLPPKVEISPEDARVFATLIHKAPLHLDQPLYRGITLRGISKNDFAEAVLAASQGSKVRLAELIRKSVRPLSKEEDRFSSFSSDADTASNFGGGAPATVIARDDGKHYVPLPGVVLVLENPKFGLVLQEGWGEQEALVPYWSFAEPLEQHIKIESDFVPKGTEIRYEKSKEDQTVYRSIMVGVTQ